MDKVIEDLETTIEVLESSLDRRARRIDDLRDEINKATPIFRAEEKLLAEYKEALGVLRQHSFSTQA